MQSLDEVSKDYSLINKQQQAKVLGGESCVTKGTTYITPNTDVQGTGDHSVAYMIYDSSDLPTV